MVAGLPHAFIYENGHMTDLNSLIGPGSGWQLHSTGGINGSGQITGYGNHSGALHAFLLTPVPEPTSLAVRRARFHQSRGLATASALNALGHQTPVPCSDVGIPTGVCYQIGLIQTGMLMRA